MSILAEKTKAPRKTQKYNNVKNTHIKISTEEGPVFTFSLPGVLFATLLSPSVTPLRFGTKLLNFIPDLLQKI